MPGPLQHLDGSDPLTLVNALIPLIKSGLWPQLLEKNASESVSIEADASTNGGGRNHGE
jgi:hypothetical protein